MKEKLPSLKALCWVYFIFTLLFYLLMPFSAIRPSLLGYHAPWHLLWFAVGLVDSAVIPGGTAVGLTTMIIAGLLFLGVIVAFVLACVKKYRLLGVLSAVSTVISVGTFVFFLLREGRGISEEGIWYFLPGILLNIFYCVLYFLSLQKEGAVSK